MPQIIVQAQTPDGGIGVVTLAERAIPTEQQNDHYTAQLMERVGWALLDAEQLESQTNISDPDGPVRARIQFTTRPVAQTPGLARSFKAG